MIRKLLIVALLLPALMACRTLKERQPVEAMQMPPKPAGTARIVLYRTDAVHGARAPVPLIAVNGETVGALDDETLYIRDVAPGDQEITLSLRDGDRRDGIVMDPSVLRASLNAGGEWYVETVVSEPCRAGTRPVPFHTVPTGTWQGDAILSGLGLASTALAYATMTCGAVYQLNPTWPQSTWNLNPLLAKAGAKPMEPAVVDDRLLPQSGLSWRVVEPVIRDHFATRADDYKPQLGQPGASSLLLQTVAFVGERAGGDAGAGVEVSLGYLQIDEATIAGRYREARLRYTLQRAEDAVTVTHWAMAD